MTEWEEYTGSGEQIKELNQAIRGGYGVLLGYGEKTKLIYTGLYRHKFDRYLICKPHPRRDMIKRQADTGQPVWVKCMAVRYENDRYLGTITVDYMNVFITTTPDWNIPNAEYSFTPFEEEV